MTIAIDAPPVRETMADLLDRLGGVAPSRVRLQPLPGTASEADLLVALRHGPTCELIDGVLVEKAVGYPESLLAAYLICLLDAFVRPRNLGLVSGPDGTLRLSAARVRAPDVAFVSWARLPGGRRPTQPIPALAPDLAIEVLSPSNTADEMLLKRQDLFAAGTLLVWEVDPRARTVSVYTAPEAVTVLTRSDTLDGGAVLPGFVLPLCDLFAEQERQQ